MMKTAREEMLQEKAAMTGVGGAVKELVVGVRVSPAVLAQV